MKRFILLFSLVMLMAGCGKGSDPTRPNDFIPLTSIQITALSSTVAAATSTQLKVIGNYSGAFTRDITSQAVWSSSAPTVASFATASQPNRISALQPGAAVVTATVSGLTTTFPLTVSSATLTTLRISPVTPSTSKGLSTQFSAVGTFSDATTQDMTFDVVWASGTPAVASISNADATKGLAQALAVGTSAISATSGAISDVAQLTVVSALLQSIAVTPANSSVAGLKKAVNFIATGTYSDGTTADISSTVTWDSTQKTVATIVAGGVATTVAPGNTSISAALGGVTGQTTLTVLTVSGLSINPTGLNLTVGTNQRFTLTATFADSSTLDVTATSEWNSTVPAIATVGNTATDKGLVNGVTAGNCVVTAAYGGLTISAPITVQ